ncbi:unnamed protein product [Spodoptera exigua]|nr:unnamed protein product [Spodoptera exigua]
MASGQREENRASAAAVSALLTMLVCATLEVNSVEGRQEPHKFTIEELLSSHFEHKDSGDLGMDPCKADLV